MKDLPLYENRLVAFIDILGFKNLIKASLTNDDLHRKLFKVLSFIKTYKNNWRFEGENRVLKISIFSDSIAISSNVFNSQFLFWSCGWLQARLLGLGVLTRGGIATGLTVHEEDLLYGEGIIKAYQIESEISKFPRVVIDPTFSTRIEFSIKREYLIHDSDEFWVINQFVPYTSANRNSYEIEEFGYDPNEEFYDVVGKTIKEGIYTSENERQKEKWNWIKEQHNNAHKEYKSKGILSPEEIIKLLEQMAEDRHSPPKSGDECGLARR